MKSSQRKVLLLGLLYLFSSLFVAAALWTHNPADPSFNSIGNRQFALNACGLFGSFFSDALLQLFGVTAWGIVALLLGLSVQAFRKKETGISWDRGTAGFLLILNMASLLSLHGTNDRIYQGNVYVSGILGRFIHSQLTRLFNTTGVALILWASVTALAIILFGHHLADKRVTLDMKWSLLLWPWNKFVALLSAAWSKLTAPRNSSPQTYPQAAQKMRIKKSETLAPVAADLDAADAEDEDDDDEGVDEAPELTEEIEIAFAEDDIARGIKPLGRRKVDLKKKVQRKIANWKLPEIGMLEDPPEERYRVDEKEIKMKSNLLVDKLNQFSVKGEVKGAKPGPAVTLFEFKPNADVKISKITELADDLSLALSSESVRIIAPIPGRDVVGIETSNSHRETVYLKDVLAMDDFWSDDMKLPMALGRQADGKPKVVDLRKMPHLLVAGTTGSGKSVFVVCALTGLLFRHSPQTLRLILIDPKQVDLAAFTNVPHLLLPLVTDAKKAVGALNWAVREMEKRYRSMSKFGARGLESYNEKVAALSKEHIAEHEHNNDPNNPHATPSYYFTQLPYIVIVVEEFGDLMAVDKNNVEAAVVRLAQMARACGIHLLLAMQSPRKDVVTGLIKTNIPGRISFKVASKMDSRIIIDDSGAERLLARGDMLFQAPGTAKPERHHGPWVTEEEIASIMTYWSDQGAPEFDEVAMRAITKSPAFSEGGGSGGGEYGEEVVDESDERYDEILAWTSGLKSVSASLIQRKFRLGYPRAARLIELFEREGVVGPPNGSKPRDVLVRSYEADKAQ